MKSSYPPGLPIPVLYTIFNTLQLVIGLAIGFCIYLFGQTSKYDMKIDILSQGDLGWVYLGVFVSKIGMMAINTNLGVSRKECKVNVPDQQVYKVYGLENAGYVLMETEGILGKFNRAQRALQNYFEQQPLYFVYFLLAGYVFPLPAFVLASIFSIFRTVGAVGYTKAADDRMKGNILAGFSMAALEGLVLLAGVKALLK